MLHFRWGDTDNGVSSYVQRYTLADHVGAPAEVALPERVTEHRDFRRARVRVALGEQSSCCGLYLQHRKQVEGRV